MIIDGLAIANEIQAELKNKIEALKGRRPCLAVIMVGDHPPSQIYVTRKTQACANVGIISIKRELHHSATEREILSEIVRFNKDPSVDGILVQLPLPPHINPFKITEAILPSKDVDGFHPLNVGKLLIGETDGFYPCTPLGIKTLIERSNIELTGQHVLVIGRSNVVGKPMAALLMQPSLGGDATVTIANRYTKDIKALCLAAHTIIVAIGKPKFITADMVREGSVLIDVGINKVEDSTNPKGYQIVGDVDFQSVKNKCSFITPVPKGVGPMTIAMLLSNTLLSYSRRQCTGF